MRTHVVLPDELVQEVDRMVGPRKRSEFVERAVREELRRDRLDWALEHGAGILREDSPEYWSTPEKTIEWIRSMRGESDASARRKLEPRPD